jgi:hypothetical protein
MHRCSENEPDTRSTILGKEVHTRRGPTLPKTGFVSDTVSNGNMESVSGLDSVSKSTRFPLRLALYFAFVMVLVSVPVPVLNFESVPDSTII